MEHEIEVTVTFYFFEKYLKMIKKKKSFIILPLQQII